MRSNHSLDTIMSRHFPRRELTPAARAVADTLLARGRALLVSFDRNESELPWRLAVTAGLRPLLLITQSERAIGQRAGALSDELDLVVCALHARLEDAHLQGLAGQLAAGKWDAALVSARSLADPRVLTAARALPSPLLVIESAQRVSMHCEQYDLAWRHAAALAEGAGSVLAIADPVPESARDDVLSQFGISGSCISFGAIDQPHLRLEARRVSGPTEMDRHLLGLLQDAPERAIVHVRERIEAERIAAVVRDECGFDAIDLTTLSPQEFVPALRRFREGGVRVLVTTGTVQPASDWPAIPVSVIVGLPGSLELLYRQMHLASGEDARAVLLHERDEAPRLERAAMRSALDAGEMLALYEGILRGDELSLSELSRRTGLHTEEVHLGIEALTLAGAIPLLGRGDDWLQAARSGALTTGALEAWGRHVADLRVARLRQIAAAAEFAATRGCRRSALAAALAYPLEEARCACDRCRPRAPVLVRLRSGGGYPLKAGECHGWALGPYRRPGDETPGGVPGKLVVQLKYMDAGDRSASAGRTLAHLMAARITGSRTYADCDLIVPVPSSGPAEQSGPAVFLAREIGSQTGLPVAEVLVSAKQRLPQKELTSLSEKQRNIEQAFEVSAPQEVAGRNVLLVDDIFDSGATMQEAAQTLLSAGAEDVRLLAAVRTTFGWRRDT